MGATPQPPGLCADCLTRDEAAKPVVTIWEGWALCNGCAISREMDFQSPQAEHVPTGAG